MPLCPRIIGGSDLFVGSRPRQTTLANGTSHVTNGTSHRENGGGRHVPSEDEDDLAADEVGQYC